MVLNEVGIAVYTYTITHTGIYRCIGIYRYTTEYRHIDARLCNHTCVWYSIDGCRGIMQNCKLMIVSDVIHRYLHRCVSIGAHKV